MIGGVTTFFTMAYIVVVNPGILATPGPGMPFSGALTATVLIASSMTLLMGLYARLPFAVAPGMGLNAFFAFTIVMQDKVPWQTALGMVFWAGVLFLVVSATPLREHIALAIPPPLRAAASAGIGLLLTFIGLRNAGLIVGDPSTLVRMGTLDHRAAFLLLGHPRRGRADAPEQPARVPGGDFLGDRARLDARVTRSRRTSWPARRTFPRRSWRSTSGARSGSRCCRRFSRSSSPTCSIRSRRSSASPAPPASPIRTAVRSTCAAASSSTRSRRSTSGLAGTSPGTAYVESIAGIRMGARTGRASVVTALCFVPCFFLGPLAAAVPGYATAAVLILVGVSMFQSVAKIDFSSLEDALPAFVTVVLIPLTLSITQGILWGFLLHALLYAVAGRWREVSLTLWLLSALSAGLLLLGH